MDQLNAIQSYIAERNPQGALNVARRIQSSIEMLRRHPLAGRPSRKQDKREWSVRRYPYVIVYEVIGDPLHTLRILGVFHTAQNERNVEAGNP